MKETDYTHMDYHERRQRMDEEMAKKAARISEIRAEQDQALAIGLIGIAQKDSEANVIAWQNKQIADALGTTNQNK